MESRKIKKKNKKKHIQKNRPRIILLDDNAINLSNRWKLLRHFFVRAVKRRFFSSLSPYTFVPVSLSPSVTLYVCALFLREIIFYLIFMWCLHIYNLKWKYFGMFLRSFVLVLLFLSSLSPFLHIPPPSPDKMYFFSSIGNAKRYTEDKCHRLMRFLIPFHRKISFGVHAKEWVEDAAFFVLLLHVTQLAQIFHIQQSLFNVLPMMSLNLHLKDDTRETKKRISLSLHSIKIRISFFFSSRSVVMSRWRFILWMVTVWRNFCLGI